MKKIILTILLILSLHSPLHCNDTLNNLGHLPTGKTLTYVLGLGFSAGVAASYLTQFRYHYSGINWNAIKKQPVKSAIIAAAAAAPCAYLIAQPNEATLDKGISWVGFGLLIPLSAYCIGR